MALFSFSLDEKETKNQAAAVHANTRTSPRTQCSSLAPAPLGGVKRVGVRWIIIIPSNYPAHHPGAMALQSPSGAGAARAAGFGLCAFLPNFFLKKV